VLSNLPRHWRLKVKHNSDAPPIGVLNMDDPIVEAHIANIILLGLTPVTSKRVAIDCLLTVGNVFVITITQLLQPDDVDDINKSVIPDVAKFSLKKVLGFVHTCREELFNSAQRRYNSI
jgi:hypothetical protein